MQSTPAMTNIFDQIGIFIVLPILIVIAWNLWLTYIQSVFLKNIKWVIIEIKPPKDVFKSPAAMELMLNSLYQTGGTGNWFDKHWKGNLRNYFSLEIVSNEGSIHFYIRTNEKFKKIIESQIYAQYPQAEVFEVPDYTIQMPDFKKDGEISLWGCDFKLDKDDAYPIKTYVDYGLDKAVGSLEEEQRIDPITPMLEFIGSIGVGEHIWFQILVRAATDRFSIKKDGKVEEGKKWTDQAKELVKELNNKLKEKDDEGKTTVRRSTKGEQGVIEAIERNANKFGFDASIRTLYITKKENFDANKIGGLTGMVRQYNTNDFNAFKPTKTTSIDFPWQDVFGNKIIKMKKDILNAYKARAFFYGKFNFKKFKKYFTHPNKDGGKPFILSTEELATIFHLPGRVSETPTFTRIESKKAEPPMNLPI